MSDIMESSEQLTLNISSKTIDFDAELKKRWNKCRDLNLFKYTVEDIPTRVIGKHSFILQGNYKRGALKRKPQEITSICQSFDEKTFNFTKISDDERIFLFDDVAGINETKNTGNLHQIVINNSPVEHCSSLLVPFINDKLPQILSIESIKLAAEVLKRSNSINFKVGFNSLGGNSSVNHLHFHMYYLRKNLYLETAKLKALHGPCWTVEDYPAKCFVFVEKESSKMDEVVSNVMKMVNFMLKNNIAHNLFITRGTGVDDSDEYDKAYLRFFLWGRSFASGSKDLFQIVPAVSELSGQVIVWKPEEFENFQETDIIDLFRTSCTDQFNFVKKFIQEIYVE